MKEQLLMMGGRGEIPGLFIFNLTPVVFSAGINYCGYYSGSGINGIIEPTNFLGYPIRDLNSPIQSTASTTTLEVNFGLYTDFTLNPSFEYIKIDTLKLLFRRRIKDQFAVRYMFGDESTNMYNFLKAREGINLAVEVKISA